MSMYSCIAHRIEQKTGKEMDFKKVIKLKTPKGEEVLVNFNNVAYCHKTNNNNTSLRFTYSQGKENKGVYLVVVEAFEEIQRMLGNNVDLTMFDKKQVENSG